MLLITQLDFFSQPSTNLGCSLFLSELTLGAKNGCKKWAQKMGAKKKNQKNQQKLKLPFCCKRITKEMLDAIEICRSICMAVQTKNVLVILF